jgi:hypothetical protein
VKNRAATDRSRPTLQGLCRRKRDFLVRATVMMAGNCVEVSLWKSRIEHRVTSLQHRNGHAADAPVGHDRSPVGADGHAWLRARYGGGIERQCSDDIGQ